MEAGVLAIVIIAVCHIPVIVFAIIGAIKLAKLKKDPNYRAEVKKKGINPIKMIPHLVTFAASVVVTIIGIVKKVQKKKKSDGSNSNN